MRLLFKRITWLYGKRRSIQPIFQTTISNIKTYCLVLHCQELFWPIRTNRFIFHIFLLFSGRPVTHYQRRFEFFVIVIFPIEIEHVSSPKPRIGWRSLKTGTADFGHILAVNVGVFGVESIDAVFRGWQGISKNVGKGGEEIGLSDGQVEVGAVQCRVNALWPPDEQWNSVST